MKSKLNVVVLLLTTFLFDWADSDGRIYGGYPVDIKKAPWMVHIATFFDKLPDGTVLYMFCSGTILRRNLILTAAHCELVPMISSEFGKIVTSTSSYKVIRTIPMVN